MTSADAARHGVGVAVVGAGVGGLATAAALRAVGHDVTVFERFATRGETGLALGIHPLAMRVFQDLGIGAEVAAGGAEVTDWELCSWQGDLLGGWSQTLVSNSFGAPSVTVERAVLHRALASTVPAELVRSDHTVTGMRGTGDAAEIDFADGTGARAALVVGADGVRSTIRGAVLGDGPPRRASFDSWRGVAGYVPAELRAGLARQILGAGATFGMWPLPGGRTYWVATVADPVLAEVTGGQARAGDIPGGAGQSDPSSTALLEHVFRSAPAPAGALISATPSERVLRTQLLHRTPVPGWSRDRAVLVGDAAHPVLPTTGQGAGQALLDAVTLADRLAGVDLADATALRGALEAYERDRYAAVESVASEAARLGALHHLTVPSQVEARDSAMRATPASVWAARMSSRAVPTAAGTADRRTP